MRKVTDFDTDELYAVHDDMTQRRIEFDKLNCEGDTHIEFKALLIKQHLEVMTEILDRMDNVE